MSENVNEKVSVDEVAAESEVVNETVTATVNEAVQAPAGEAAPGVWQRFAAAVKAAWPQILRPIAVLGCICLGVSAVLAVTNWFTAPVIAEAERQRAIAARQALLPADDYVQVEGSWASVTEVWQALTGGEVTGYVITGTANGFGGAVPAMVAFDTNGTILGLAITDTEETQGYGTKVEEPAFRDQFGGLAAAPLTLNVDVDQVAGATVSSRAAVNAVNAAIDAYNTLQKEA